MEVIRVGEGVGFGLELELVLGKELGLETKLELGSELELLLELDMWCGWS